TSSAMASSPGGKLRPNALAVLRLITNSNLVDCMTGRSEGFSPLRIRPMYTPAWRYESVMLVRLAADTAYGSGTNLNWLVQDKKIAPHIPVIDKSRREDGTFSRDDFTFDKQRNVYSCPAGKTLTTTGQVGQRWGNTPLYG